MHEKRRLNRENAFGSVSVSGCDSATMVWLWFPQGAGPVLVAEAVGLACWEICWGGRGELGDGGEKGRMREGPYLSEHRRQRTRHQQHVRYDKHRAAWTVGSKRESEEANEQTTLSSIEKHWRKKETTYYSNTSPTHPSRLTRSMSGIVTNTMSVS